MIDQAVTYLKRGMSVIPLKPQDKRPLLSSWKDYQRKQMGIGDLKGFWKETPEANIGIITGAISGITVVDVDGDDGAAALKEANIQLPETYTVKTPKGWHYYYKYNNLFKTGAGFLKNVDVRNDAGYVVAPPSSVNSTDYVVIVDNNGEFSEFGVVPEPFINRSTGSFSPENTGNIDPWITEALANGAPEGQRDHTATRLAGYFWSRGISEDIIKPMLEQFASKCTPPFPEKDIDRVVNSVKRYKQTKVRAFTDGVIPRPLCKVTPTGDVEIVWSDNGVTITFSNVRKTFERLSCQLVVRSHQVGDLLGPVAFDLMSMSRRKEAIAALNNTQNEDWAAILDVACRIARDAQEDTTEFLDISKSKFDKTATDWLIDGFLPKGQPTVLYADGGTGKSMLAIATAMSVSSLLPIIEGIKEPSDTGAVLYLDWETDEAEVMQRMNFIANGVTQSGRSPFPLVREDFPLTYVRCTAALTALQPKIAKWTEANDCKLVIVDSLIPALDGDANDSETARKFMNTLRSFNCSALVLSHTSKEGKLFGSTFWSNLARNVWEIRKEQDLGQDYSDLALIHKKSNNSSLAKPIGIRMKFDKQNESVTFNKFNVADTTGTLAASLPVKSRIIQLLKSEGALTVKEIVQQLGSSVTESSVGMALNRGSRTEFVLTTDAAGVKRWGLLLKQ